MIAKKGHLEEKYAYDLILICSYDGNLKKKKELSIYNFSKMSSVLQVVEIK